MLRNLLCSFPLLFMGGCGGHDHGHGHDHDHDHHHDPVHEGGQLVELGDHLGQFEAVLDVEAGTLSFWVWDAHCENAVRLPDESLAAEVTIGEETFTLACAAQESTLTGETVGDSSEFSAQDDRLKGIEKAEVKVPSLNFKGATYEDLAFQLPPQ